MSRQQRRIPLPLVGIVLLCLLLGVNWLVWKRFWKPGRSSKVVKHKVETNSDDALKYWTSDRMQSAKPVELPNVDTLERGKPEKRRPSGQ